MCHNYIHRSQLPYEQFVHFSGHDFTIQLTEIFRRVTELVAEGLNGLSFEGLEVIRSGEPFRRTLHPVFSTDNN